VQGMIDEMLEIAPMTGGELGGHMKLEKEKRWIQIWIWSTN